MKTVPFWLYIILCVAEISSEYFQISELKLITKPMLMPALILLLLQYTEGISFPAKKTLIISLVFSWFGDIALMFTGPVRFNATELFYSPHFFIVGLVCFLIAHLLYIFVFKKYTLDNKKGIVSSKPMVLAPLLLYMFVLLWKVLPAISANEKDAPMLIPVVIYSTVIACMVLYAILRYGRVNEVSFKLTMLGALFFMLSDSIIAINKFLYAGDLPLAGVGIMTLYLAGQLLIVLGIIKQYKEEI